MAGSHHKLAMQGIWSYFVRVSAWVSQIRKGVLELAVLGLLAGEPRYGSQLVDDLGEYEALAITAGTVYPLLSRLKKAGLIDSVWRESPVGPPRKYYSLTDVGREVLAEMTGTWRAVDAAITNIVEQT